MRILFELPYGELGGTEKHLFNLISALGNKIEPCLITPYGKGLPLVNDLRIPYEVIPHFALDFSLRNSISSHHKAFKKLFHNFRFSLIHVHAGIEYAVAAKLASRETPSLPLVFTIHGYQDIASYLVSGILANRLVDEVICVSDAERKKAEMYGWTKTKLSTICNGVPAPSLAESLDEIRAQWKIPKNAYVIGTVARLERSKGINYLISAMPKVIFQYPDTVLLVVGDGKKRSSLMGLSRELGISQHVIFTGQFPDPASALSIMDVFVLPSLKEAFGIAVLEAMALSKPVVATEVGGIPEAVLHNKTGFLLPPGNSEAITSALLELAKNPATCKAFGIAGKKRFEEHFTDSIMARQTLAVYQRVLAKQQ